MTHEGILKVNEFFNNKLAKSTENIRISITYTGNFGNTSLFQNLRKILKALQYENVKGQIDTVYCIVDAIKTGELEDADITANISATSKTYWSTKEVIAVFRKLLSVGKISFDDRIRRDALVALFLDANGFNIKTSSLSLKYQKELHKNFIEPLIKSGLFICKGVYFKTEANDLYQQVYENAKSVMTNMNSRGISHFAIASYFWMNNRDSIATPFLSHWSSHNFIQALMTTNLYNSTASKEVKDGLSRDRAYWTVLSDSSLMTGKVSNFDPRRKELNQLINNALNSEGEDYLKRLLKKIKLVASSNPIANEPVVYNRDIIRNIEKLIQNQLKDRTTKIPSKEIIIESIKYQFMISKILDIDFSSKRKDHLVLDKGSKQRVFDIL